MKLRKGLALLLCLIMLVSVGLTGCGDKTEAVEEKETATTEEVTTTETETPEATEVSTEVQRDAVQTYTVSSGSVVTSLDPHKVGSIPVWQVQAPLYENLVRYVQYEDGSAGYEPGVAETWEVSADGLVWTFHLRDNAKWNDGSVLNAHDFVYSWQRVFDPEVASDYEWMVDSMIKGGGAFSRGEGTREEVGVTALDDLTLQIELEMKVGYFLQVASFPTYKPVQKAAVENFGEEYGTAIDKIVTNGAYQVSEWNAGQNLVYVPNPYYWNAENVFLQKIERKIVSEEAARAQALLNGELDAAGIADPQWRSMLDEDGTYNYINEAGADVEFFMYNVKNEYLSNKKIRQALSIAFNRERYIEEVGNGFGFPAYSMVPSVMHAGDKLYSEYTQGQNEVVKVLMNENPDPKALLIEGLIELGKDPDPSKMSVIMQTRGVSENIKTSAEWLRQLYAEELGIDLVIELTPWNVMWDNVRSGSYDIAVGGWTADVDDPSNMIEIFHTDPNVGYYNSTKTGWAEEDAAEFNEFVMKAKNADTNEEKAMLFLEAEKILLEESIVSPRSFGETSTYRAKYVKGLFSNSFTYIDYVGVYTDGKQ